MIYDEASDNGKTERALKRELDLALGNDTGHSDDYEMSRTKVEDRKKAKRLAKLQKKLRRRNAS